MTKNLSSPPRALRIFLDTLFPITCIGCGAYGAWICARCLRCIPLLNTFVCPLCEKRPTPFGATCFHCVKNSSIDGLIVASSYKNILLSRAVHYFKYRFVHDLSDTLGDLLTRQLLQTTLPLPDALIPVPLYKRRLRWRGFNQAELLADVLSERITPGLILPVHTDILLRRHATRPQMKIKNYSERKKNMYNAFLVQNKKMLKDKNILLVDDITTTGATLFSCASALKKAGAKSVWGIVLARQELRKI